MHQSESQLNLAFRRLLGLLLKSIEKDHKLALVKAAENAIYVATQLHPYLIQAFVTFYMLQKLFRDSLRMGHQVKHEVNLLLHFDGQPGVKLLEMMLVEYQFTNLIHGTKLT